MELRREVDFAEALSRLQDAIGCEVQVVVELSGQMLGCDFTGRLERVATISHREGSVLVVFDRGQGIALDPTEISAFVGSFAGQKSEWLEFRLAGSEGYVLIEPLEAPRAAPAHPTQP